MNIFRNILVGLASFVFIISITGFVYVLTLQTTIMDRTVVKSWLNESGLYDGRLIGALVQTTNAGGGPNGTSQPATDTLSASPEALKTALNATFTPDFTKTQIEGVIDNAYDWIDGTSPEFNFSIPIDQKRDTLITELAKAIEPQIAALPACQSIQFTQDSVCRPPNVSTEQLARQLTTESIDQSDTFTKPLTNESFVNPNQPAMQQPEQASLSQLPSISKGIEALLVILPIAAVISLLAIILTTVSGQRLARAARLSRRVFFGMLFIFLPAALVVWLAKDNDFGLSSMFAAQTSALAVPLIKAIAIGMLEQLALISGIVGIVSVMLWIALTVWQHNTNTQKPAAVAPVIPPTPPAPIQPQTMQAEVPQNDRPNDYPRQ